MEKKITITIIDTRTTWAKWLRNLVATLLLVAAPISIGILANSAAMQWAGFIFSGLVIVHIARSGLGEKTAYTIAEARALLDALEVDHV